MKALNLMLLLLLVTGSAVAQSSSNTQDAPGVVVVEKRWRMIERNPKLEEDPLAINTQQANLERAQKEAIRENAARASASQPARPIPTQSSMPVVKTGRSSPWVEYVYEIKVSNNGTKTIRKLFWEYVASTPNSQPRAGRRHFVSKIKIRPGQTRKLTERSPFPPLGVVDARQEKAAEQVLIQKIEYTDGSVWTRDSE